MHAVVRKVWKGECMPNVFQKMFGLTWHTSYSYSKTRLEYRTQQPSVDQAMTSSLLWSNKKHVRPGCSIGHGKLLLELMIYSALGFTHRRLGFEFCVLPWSPSSFPGPCDRMGTCTAWCVEQSRTRTRGRPGCTGCRRGCSRHPHCADVHAPRGDGEDGDPHRDLRYCSPGDQPRNQLWSGHLEDTMKIMKKNIYLLKLQL